jgi:hypothetical protein
MPALRGPRLIDDDRMVVLRSTALVCNRQFRMTPEYKSLVRDWIFGRDESNLSHNIQASVQYLMIRKELVYSKRITACHRDRDSHAG